MWKTAIIVIAVVAASVMPHPRAGFACSADASWDPVAESDVIVGGRITAIRELAPPSPDAMFVPVALELDVRDTWKGALPPGALVFDGASLVYLRTSEGVSRQWHGSGGACGAFDEDPTGSYAILGLTRQPDGLLRTNLLTKFYLSRAPYDLSQLSQPASRLGLPQTGMHPSAGESNDALAAASAVFALGTMMTALGIRRRGLRQH